MILDISQNSQENTCVGVSFLIKLQAWGLFTEHLWATAFEVLSVLVNQWMFCMMSLESGKIRCVALLDGPRKAGRGLIYKEPFRVILSFSQKLSLGKLESNAKQVYFNIDFLQFYSFFLHSAETTHTNFLKWLILKKFN